MDAQFLTEHVAIKKISDDDKVGVFEIDGLYRGYGVTVGNAIRRVLLSSLPGAAITRFKIKGVGHEFSAIPGVIEDVVEIGLNLKKVRFIFNAGEPQTLILKVKGEKAVTAADIKGNAEVSVANPDSHIATLSSKDAELEIEITVEKGLGYVPVLGQKIGKLAVGTMALDAVFSPVKNANFIVSNMRVGEKIDYNKVRIEIETDGTISPSRALNIASNILFEHFKKISEMDVRDVEVVSEPEKPAKKSKKS
ncbi:MAG: DNA-directed RNA polymerase subunit alpha [Candidatus Colwellbacteria bacterium RIFCSPLOWO2_01_FULL_48_10]|uniref:DNA-directed RNA polymerase subunit alpha n=1 Tax=Candidatus Colwellbacteria bacterium RIFCSPLOWO2_01_FULL_48_10 TaxID=1797690 RepID=A0A1G1Z5F2_9BACT|nr:MAG: DNA-directed RNA polymerase subunit alpha [Candidatus Colwellbacteria bacterium RIFCSPLOWO2_01_FULL_48_10]